MSPNGQGTAISCYDARTARVRSGRQLGGWTCWSRSPTRPATRCPLLANEPLLVDWRRIAIASGAHWPRLTVGVAGAARAPLPSQAEGTRVGGSHLGALPRQGTSRARARRRSDGDQPASRASRRPSAEPVQQNGPAGCQHVAGMFAADAIPGVATSTRELASDAQQLLLPLAQLTESGEADRMRLRALASTPDNAAALAASGSASSPRTTAALRGYGPRHWR